MSNDNQEPLIRHISDTARWAAVYRAKESERRDAVFHDPFARRLAGQRGQEIAASLPFYDRASWAWVSRTWLFDTFITQQLQQGVDLVLNLAAGLDARPYRMNLPSSLTWIEVDLPEILDYKEDILRDEKPVCKLERMRLDLADENARRQLFASVGQRASRALIITEGLLIYLTEEQVGALAEDLARQQSFRRWVLDIASPGLLRMLQKNTQFGEDVPPLKFAPANGPEFFTAHRWKPLEVRSMIKTGRRLKRLSLIFRLFSFLPENPAHMGSRLWSGGCLMGREAS
jgi:methyltransferase (TIGR00027 family)